MRIKGTDIYSVHDTYRPGQANKDGQEAEGVTPAPVPVNPTPAAVVAETAARATELTERAAALRVAHVGALRATLGQGSYHIDYGQLADRILDDVRSRGGIGDL